ncbi:MAG TPA: FGGY family carbohydrate kinase, partial [Acidimicrobiales bacterium]|nr:FGGY family carbohydrate kinase [Acidimicrobiales bacterium]
MTGASQSASGSPLTVGLDIGTTSCKAVLVDDHGEVLGRCRMSSGLIAGEGTFRHDAAESWWELPRRALAQVAAGFGERIAGVAVCAPVPSLAPVGPEGRPLGPGLLYGDEHSRPPVGDRVSRGAKRPPSDDPTASAEMLHMATWASRAFPHAEGFWPAQAVANASLSGEGVLDLASAFGTGSLYNGAGWDEPTCAAAGIVPSKLPRVAVFGEPVGRVRSALV